LRIDFINIKLREQMKTLVHLSAASDASADHGVRDTGGVELVHGPALGVGDDIHVHRQQAAHGGDNIKVILDMYPYNSRCITVTTLKYSGPNIESVLDIFIVLPLLITERALVEAI
jgi:hypothetical protein